MDSFLRADEEPLPPAFTTIEEEWTREIRRLDAGIEDALAWQETVTHVAIQYVAEITTNRDRVLRQSSKELACLTKQRRKLAYLHSVAAACFGGGGDDDFEVKLAANVKPEDETVTLFFGEDADCEFLPPTPPTSVSLTVDDFFAV
jgi:hypothetical protein